MLIATVQRPLIRALDYVLARLYPHLMCAVQGLVWLRCWWRKRKEPPYGLRIRERFGRYATPAAAPSYAPIWIHAVSLGETLAAAPLLALLRQDDPRARFLLTHCTATGWQTGLGLLGPLDQQTWLPWDCPRAVERFLLQFRPRVAILMETELWPCVIAACAARNIPTVLANARLSERSARKFALFPRFFRPTFHQIQLVLAQTAEDAQRFVSMSCQQVRVCGNLKDDARPNACQVALAQQWRRPLQKPVLVLASSHEGEERAFAEHIKAANLTRYVHILLVPRHPHRFAAVQRLCEQLGFAVSKRSTWEHPAATVPERPADLAPIWLGDSIGEMALYYSLADAALLGGSFVAHGGQNLLEALACNCPVWTGPHTWNFASALAAGRQAGVVFPCADMSAALTAMLPILRHPQQLRDLRQASQTFMRQRGGAGKRMLQAIAPLIERQSGVNAQRMQPQRS